MRPTVLNPLFVPVTAVGGVGPKLGKLVAGFCGDTVADVLWHLPIGVNYRPKVVDVSQIKIGEYATVEMLVEAHQIPPSKKVPYRIIGSAVGRDIEMVFFNYHKSYLGQKYPVGKTIWVSGRIEQNGFGFKIIHPDYITENPVYADAMTDILLMLVCASVIAIYGYVRHDALVERFRPQPAPVKA